MAATAAPSPYYQPGLTGLRALAAGWVMLFHLNAFAGPRAIAVDVLGVQVELHPLLTIGWVGVDLFFALSGFLLATHLLRALERPREGLLRAYFAARLRRVLPAYWAQLAILLVVAVAAAGTLPDWAGYLPLHLTLLHFATPESSFAINKVYWTLPIEFAFYLLLPPVALLLARAERRGRLAAWASLAAVYAGSVVLVQAWRHLVFAGLHEEPGRMMWAITQLPGTLDVFMAGVVAAAALRWSGGLEHRGRGALSTALTAAGLAGVVGMMYFVDAIHEVFWRGHWALFSWHSITAAFAAIAVAGIALGGPLARALFETRPVVFLGTISYSIYLWHFPIGLWALERFPPREFGHLGFFALTIPLVLAASALSYRLVERPFLRR